MPVNYFFYAVRVVDGFAERESEEKIERKNKTNDFRAHIVDLAIRTDSTRGFFLFF